MKIQVIAGPNTLMGDGTTRILPVVTGRLDDLVSSAEGFVWDYPGTFRALAIAIDTNDTTASGLLRLYLDDIGGNNEVSIPAGTTGSFLDTSGSTDTTGGGTELKLQMTVGTGGTACDSAGVSIVYESSEVNPFFKIGGYSALGHTGTDVTYVGIFEQDNDATETNVETQFLYDVTVNYLDTYVDGNVTVGTQNFTLRKNGTNTALTVSIPGTTTGKFSNIDDSVSFTADTDTVCFALTGTGALDLDIHASIQVENTENNKFILGTQDRSGLRLTDNNYFSVCGDGDIDTYTNSLAIIGSPMLFTDARASIINNAQLSSSTLDLRKNNTTTTLQINIPALTSGLFTTSGRESFDAGDTIVWQVQLVSDVENIELKWLETWGEENVLQISPEYLYVGGLKIRG